jgi:3-vinyl bacteriochlorophyllide hydratase
LIARYMVTGEGETAAVWSVVFKTLVLYAIMVTGSIWEKVVFDKWLFAPAFFWEDVFSFLVLGLHTAYLWSLYTGNMGTRDQLWLALAAYAAYAINAGQFLLKLRAARAQERATLAMHQELAT